jgi:hypothetical protein
MQGLSGVKLTSVYSEPSESILTDAYTTPIRRTRLTGQAPRSRCSLCGGQLFSVDDDKESRETKRVAFPSSVCKVDIRLLCIALQVLERTNEGVTSRTGFRRL